MLFTLPNVQASVSGLVAKVRLAVAISPLLEEAFRIMPRSLTLPASLVGDLMLFAVVLPAVPGSGTASLAVL